MSATTPSYAAHLITAQADSGKASGALFTWLFGTLKTKTPAHSVPALAASSLPFGQDVKAAPKPSILRLPESVAAELLRALQPGEAKSVTNRQVGVARPLANQEQSAPAQIRSRQFSTSVLETEDRGFPII